MRDEAGHEVAVTKGVAARVKKFLSIGGPASLWADHLNVARIVIANKAINAHKTKLNDEGVVIMSETDLSDKRNNAAAVRAINAGEVGKAYDFITSDCTPIMLDKEEAWIRMTKKYGYANVNADGLADDIDHILDQAHVDNLFDHSESGKDAISLETARAISVKYTALPQSDEMGYRSFYFRQIFHKSAEVVSDISGQQAFLFLLGKIAFGRIPLDIVQFLYSWSLSVLSDTSDHGSERLVNAPLNFARFAFSFVSFDDKAEWASVLEPFQLSGGTSGGSEILASIDMAMSSLTPVGWARIKLDFKSFFYRANMKLCVMALKEHKMFKQILQLKAAFAQRGSMVVFYDSADYGKVSFQAPPNGLPPGHPLSSNLCSISAKSAWDCASKMLYEACLYPG